MNNSLNKVSANLKTIINDSATIKKLKGQVIQKELALISIDNKPTIYKNSITLLQGKSGTNKSRLAQTIVSNLICKKDTYNGLNIYSNSNELVAVYIDTERNIFNQFPRSIQDIIMAAGFDKSEDPKNLEYTSLIKISRESRQISIEEYIKHLQSKYSQHLFIVLDVITDCLGDFNNSSDSLGLVDYLNKLVNNYDCTILGVIHVNPGKNNKARGHIGTELTNKATTIIEIIKIEALFESYHIVYKKSRNTEIQSPIDVVFDKNTRLLKLTSDVQNIDRESGIKKAPVSDVIDYLSIHMLKDKYKKQELENMISTHFVISPKTANERLQKVVLQELKILNDNIYFQLGYSSLTGSNQKYYDKMYCEMANEPTLAYPDLSKEDFTFGEEE